MTHRTPVWLLTFLVLPGVAAAQHPEPAPPALSLEAAVRQAIEHNDALHIAGLQVDRAERDIAVARTRRLPTFELSATASELLTPVAFTFPRGALGVYSATGPIPATDTRVTTPRQPTAYLSGQVVQPLSQLVGIGLSTKAAVVERDVERERMRARHLALVNDVTRTYLAILQSESAVRAASDALALYAELVRATRQHVVQQVALRSDLLSVELRLAEEELAVQARRNRLAGEKERLNQMLGRDVRTPFAIEGVAEMTPVSTTLERAQDVAVNRRPDIAEARLAVRQAELDYRITKAARMPEVSLSVSYNSYFNMAVLPRNLATIGVQVTWEPFDWGRRGQQLAARKLGIEQASHRRRDVEGQALLEVNERHRALLLARARLFVTQAGQQAAGEKLRVAVNKYQSQATLLSEVLAMRAEVSAAQDRHQQALLELWTAKSDFARAVGEEDVR